MKEKTCKSCKHGYDALETCFAPSTDRTTENTRYCLCERSFYHNVHVAENHTCAEFERWYFKGSRIMEDKRNALC